MIQFKKLTLQLGIIGAFSLLLVEHAFAGKDVVISQKGKAFSKEEVSIKVGDTLVFKNDDDTSHNVFSSSQDFKFNLGITKTGSEVKQSFSQPGELEIRCAIHPKMKIKVTVKK